MEYKTSIAMDLDCQLEGIFCDLDLMEDDNLAFVVNELDTLVRNAEGQYLDRDTNKVQWKELISDIVHEDFWLSPFDDGTRRYFWDIFWQCVNELYAWEKLHADVVSEHFEWDNLSFVLDEDVTKVREYVLKYWLIDRLMPLAKYLNINL